MSETENQLPKDNLKKGTRSRYMSETENPLTKRKPGERATKWNSRVCDLGMLKLLRCLQSVDVGGTETLRMVRN